MKYIVAFVLVLTSAKVFARESHTELTDKLYEAHGADKGVVLIHVNWGRYWNCHGYENAQLQKLVFQSMPFDSASGERLELKIPSRLFAKNTFHRYALLVPPGEYGLTSFRFKLAASKSDLRIYEPGSEDLVVGGKSEAGSFQVSAGEIVYIGHFGVDCNGDPSPWRFYIEDPEDFAGYSAEFHDEFPSTRSVPLTYRLFETESIGNPYALPVPTSNDVRPGKASESLQ